MSDIRDAIARKRARVEAATKGPWRADDDSCDFDPEYHDKPTPDDDYRCDECGGECEGHYIEAFSIEGPVRTYPMGEDEGYFFTAADADFIAAARNDYEKLLDVVDVAIELSNAGNRPLADVLKRPLVNLLTRDLRAALAKLAETEGE